MIRIDSDSEDLDNWYHNLILWYYNLIIIIILIIDGSKKPFQNMLGRMLIK